MLLWSVIQIHDVMELYVMLVFGVSDFGFEFRKSTSIKNTMDLLVLCWVNRVLRISCEFSPFDDDVFCGFPSGRSSVMPFVDFMYILCKCTDLVFNNVCEKCCFDYPPFQEADKDKLCHTAPYRLS